MNKLLGRKAKIGVEIGTYKGESAKIISEYTDFLITIDPYKAYNDAIGKTVWLKRARSIMLESMKDLDNVSLMKMSSTKAFEILKGCDFDFVYIDGNHNYPHVMRDIAKWSQNCKVVGGHDYHERFPGTIRAVNEMAKKLKKRKIKAFIDTSWILI